MKHLLLLSPGFAADERDSPCIPPLQLFAQALHAEDGIKVSILSLHYPYSCESKTWNSIPTYSAFQKGPLKKIRIAWQVRKWIQQIHRQDPLHGIHSFWLSDAALFGHWMSRVLSIPHWVTLMGQDARPSNRYLSILPLQKMQTISLSTFHNQVLLKSTGVSTNHIIPWGLPPTSANSLAKDIDILGVGNLIPLKNYTLFIRLVASLKKQRPKMKAVLVGEGPERVMLERMIREYGLEQNLRLTGAIDRAEVLKYMARSRVFLHPSTYESFGFVFLEALAQGMYLVSRPVGIAKASEQWYLGEEEAALKTALYQALGQEKPAEPSFPHLLSDTVQKYREVYERKMDKETN